MIATNAWDGGPIIPLKRYYGDDVLKVPPFHWMATIRWSGEWAAIVSCSQGHVNVLAEHRIGLGGLIHPSLVCPDCDWHVYARLEEWDGSGPIFVTSPWLALQRFIRRLFNHRLEEVPS